MQRHCTTHSSMGEWRPEAAATEAQRREVAGRPLIRLAEDNAVQRDLALLLSAQIGCCVTPVTDGVAAIHALQRTDYRLVLMDCQMPHLDGYRSGAGAKPLCSHNSR